jgi:hypothetical protein
LEGTIESQEFTDSQLAAQKLLLGKAF